MHVSDNTIRFGAKDGMNLAFALVDYGGEVSGFSENEKTATLQFYLRSWGHDKDGEIFIKMDKLETHQCTNVELGVKGKEEEKDGDLELMLAQSKFYQIYSGSKPDVEKYQHRFRCLDIDQVTLIGDSDSFQAQVLVLALELCDMTKTECDETFDPVTAFQNMYVAYLKNEKTFNKIELHPNAQIEMESKLIWKSIPT